MLGSMFLPIIFSLVMMAVCCGGLLLVGRWRRARRRPRPGPLTVTSKDGGVGRGWPEGVG
jgi:hypothetical protein